LKDVLEEDKFELVKMIVDTFADRVLKDTKAKEDALWEATLAKGGWKADIMKHIMKSYPDPADRANGMWEHIRMTTKNFYDL
jgi:hypothetical protein